MTFSKLLQTEFIKSILILLLGFQVVTVQVVANELEKVNGDETPPAAETGKKRDDIVVVITANRGEEKDVLDIPQSVSKVDKHDIQHTVYQDVDDIIRLMPNVKMANAVDGHGQGNTQGNHWQEGFSVRGLGNQRVLVLNDGVRQAGQGVGYGGGNLSLYDPLSIESIEVLRGPSSVLYGTDAIGGVINITTRNPKLYTKPGGNMGVRYSFDEAHSMNRVSGYAEIGQQDMGLVFGWTFSDVDCPKLPDGDHATDGSYKQGGGWLKADYYFNENSKVRVIANQTRADDVLMFNTSGAAGIKFFFPIYERTNLGAEFEFIDISDRLDLAKIGFYWQRVKRKLERTAPDFTVMGFPTFAPGPDKMQTFTNDRVNTYEIDPQFHFDFDPHRIIVGADIALDAVFASEDDKRYESTGALKSTTSRTRVDARQHRLGLYLQDTWELYPFELVLGGRFDQFYVKNSVGTQDKHSPKGVSGSAGLVYHYSETFSYYANAATGFRVPDLSERYQDTVVTVHAPVTVKGNADLKPERSYSFELGTKSRFEWVSYEFAVFATQIDDYIGVERISASPKIDMHKNRGGIFLYGYEGAITMTPYDPWFIYFNFARTYTKDTGIVPVPRWTFNYGTSYRLDGMGPLVKSVTPEISGRTQQKSMDNINGTEFGGFTVFDAQVAFDLDLHIKNTTAKWIIGVKNILNEKYKEPFFFLSHQPARSIFTSVQMEF